MGPQWDPTGHLPPPSPPSFGVPHLHLSLQSRVGPQRGGHHLWGDGEVVGQPGAAAQQDGVHPIQVLRPEKRVVLPVLHHVVWGGPQKSGGGASGDPKSSDVMGDPKTRRSGTPNLGQKGPQNPETGDPK